MSLKRIIGFITISLFANFAFAKLEFSVEHSDEGARLKILDKKTGETFNGPSGFMLGIDGVEDLDGDGVDEALISTSVGGNCCPTEFLLIGVKNKKVESLNINDDWADVSLDEQQGKDLIKVKTINQTQWFGYKDGELFLVKSQEQLEALAEVHGVDGNFISGEKPRILRYDINNDDVEDEIVCEVWERWGSLLCELPTAEGTKQKLSVGCNRFGVLPSVNNGYHEFVCNNDKIITFNGRKWIEK